MVLIQSKRRVGHTEEHHDVPTEERPGEATKSRWSFARWWSSRSKISDETKPATTMILDLEPHEL